MNRKREKLDVMVAGILIFTATYLGFAGLVLVPTTLNQFNLGITFNYGSTGTFYGAMNSTLTTASSYSGFSLAIILPIIIIAVFILAIACAGFSYKAMS